MKCKDVDFGTYDCAYNVMLPYMVQEILDRQGKKIAKTVAIDKCLLPEILKLWEMGIKTTGCCCGHGNEKPFIGVKEEFIPKMKELGYTVQYNPFNPTGEDTFDIKTVIDREDADCGFNWWEENI